MQWWEMKFKIEILTIQTRLTEAQCGKPEGGGLLGYYWTSLEGTNCCRYVHVLFASISKTYLTFIWNLLKVRRQEEGCLSHCWIGELFRGEVYRVQSWWNHGEGETRLLITQSTEDRYYLLSQLHLFHCGQIDELENCVRKHLHHVSLRLLLVQS